MQIDLPGLLCERLPSGSHRWRVRVEGRKWQRIALSVGPDHPLFMEHYRAARAGVKLEPAASPADAAIPMSVAWLTHSFEEAMQARVKAGLLHPGTLHQRAAFYARLRAEYGAKHAAMPRSAVIKMRDKMTSTPGAADNMVKAIRALYAWAIDHGHVTDNPASGIGRINRGTGATAWSVEDLAKFREKHPLGTMAHVALSLFAFLACRIGDAPHLGPHNEVPRDGIASLHWQPAKRGSAPVTVPILPPLARALEARPMRGPTYLLTAYGKPFASPAAFGNKFRGWVIEAGLTDRSPHGIRKAASEWMAANGASQYQIMSVLGHTQAKTSEVYTAGVDRTRLAAEAVRSMGGMDW